MAAEGAEKKIAHYLRLFKDRGRLLKEGTKLIVLLSFFFNGKIAKGYSLLNISALIYLDPNLNSENPQMHFPDSLLISDL